LKRNATTFKRSDTKFSGSAKPAPARRGPTSFAEFAVGHRKVHLQPRKQDHHGDILIRQLRALPKSKCKGSLQKNIFIKQIDQYYHERLAAQSAGRYNTKQTFAAFVFDFIGARYGAGGKVAE
jgi:hypothetical protein